MIVIISANVNSVDPNSGYISSSLIHSFLVIRNRFAVGKDAGALPLKTFEWHEPHSKCGCPHFSRSALFCKILFCLDIPTTLSVMCRLVFIGYRRIGWQNGSKMFSLCSVIDSATENRKG
jgi:hypothetical protein